MAYKIFRGDSKTYEITVTDSIGSPVNITGSSQVMTVKKKDTDEDDEAVISKEGVITDAQSGQFEIRLTSTDSAVNPDNYIFDIQITLAGGEKYTLIKDNLEILQDVTQS